MCFRVYSKESEIHSDQAGIRVNPHYVDGYFCDVRVDLGGGKTTPRSISASRLARNKIPTAASMFSGLKCSMVLSVTFPYKTGSQKSKMAAEIL